jgi:hypothetical protein
MSKIFSIGYDDVQSIIDAGPEDAWVSRELGALVSAGRHQIGLI